MPIEKVVEFKPRDEMSEKMSTTETQFEELVEVVVRLRAHVLCYHDTAEIMLPHEGPCSAETVCDEACEQVSVLNLSNGLLNRLDNVLRKLELM